MRELFILYGKTIAVYLGTQKNKRGREGHQGQKYVDKTCITLRRMEEEKRRRGRGGDILARG